MMYEDERDINEQKLMELCLEVIDVKNCNAIYNTLFRNGIRSIDDLKRTDLNRIRRFRTIGEMRFEFIKEMKLIIEERGL